MIGAALVAHDGGDDVAVTTRNEATPVDVGKDITAITHAATSVRLSAVLRRTTARLSSGQFHELEFSNMFENHAKPVPRALQQPVELPVIPSGGEGRCPPLNATGIPQQMRYQNSFPPCHGGGDIRLTQLI